MRYYIRSDILAHFADQLHKYDAAAMCVSRSAASRRQMNGGVANMYAKSRDLKVCAFSD